MPKINLENKTTVQVSGVNRSLPQGEQEVTAEVEEALIEAGIIKAKAVKKAEK